MKKLILVTTFFVANLSGCAFTTESIDIKYSPQSNVTNIPTANRITVNVRVRDTRLDKSKVSSKKNGYGMETAPILANEKVEITTSNAIENELIARGFHLGTDAQMLINADISRFYNEHKVGFFSGDAIADFEMAVFVQTKTGQQIYFKHIKTQGTEADTQLMNGENAALALSLALKNGIKMLFDDKAFIDALLQTTI